MPDTAVSVFLFAAVFESLLIIVANIFTIFVFWKHRNKLKRTYFLLINLALVDLLVGFTEPIALGAFDIPQHFEKQSNNIIVGNNISTAFQTAFSFESIFFLLLISLERAYALIWPLHHRAASFKVYLYSAAVGWIAGISVGILTLLAVYNILDVEYWTYALGCFMFLCLVTICVSYLAIRARNIPNGLQESAKFSRTLFVVISASLLFWLPSIIAYCVHYLCSACVSQILLQVFNISRLANSLVNPIIYSFKIPMFRETFQQMKLCKQSNEYRVNYVP